MKFPVLSGMVAAGILNKKDRILCYQEGANATLSWLRRQRFKVEGPLPASMTGVTHIVQATLYDVVITEKAGSSINNAGEHHASLREAIRFVRPGGRLLVCYSNDSLFDMAAPDAILVHLRECFAGETVVSITPLQKVDQGSDPIFTVKKAGAYKPRLPVNYIEVQEQFDAACAQIVKEDHIGLDVETTLKEPRILCTAQIATERRVYLMDMLPVKDLRPLKAIMEDVSILKIIHNKDFEAGVLGQYGIQIHNVYDTLIESRKRHKAKKGTGGHRLGDVCERELGIYLDKSYQASDWTRRPLSQEQKDYAAADAEVMIRLYNVFEPPKPPETMELF